MSVKTEVLKLLEANRDRDLSGQEIADQLGVTRAAVWKAVKALKGQGYRVDAANNRGYRLCDDNDVISAEGICPALKEEYRQREICICRCVDSTNQEVKRRALEGAGEGFVVLAEEQTAGKGNLYEWTLPANSGAVQRCRAGDNGGVCGGMPGNTHGLGGRARD